MESNPTGPVRPIGKQARFYLAVIGLLVTLFVAGRVFLVQEVTFAVDGKEVVVTTFGGTVAEALEKARIKVADVDRVQPAPTTKVKDGMKVTVIRAVPVTVRDGGKETLFWTSAASIAEALKEKGIKVAPEDRVEPSLSTPVKAGLIVGITRAVPLAIEVDGRRLQVKSAQGTVAQVLAEAKVNLNPQDKVYPALTAPVVPDLNIKVTRVAFQEEQVEEPIPFDTVRRKDRTMAYGINKVLQEGKNGLARLRYRITMEDGRPVKKELVGRSILKPAISRIIAMGTLQTISRGGTQFRYSEVLTMEATAYTHTGRRTASGTYPSRGVAAVDPQVIPLGSRLYIEGYGYATALDRGGDIKGNRIDLFFESYREAINWGVRTKKVYILD